MGGFFENSIGPLFPDGNFPDLEERLDAYFTHKMSAEERAVFGHKVSYARSVFDKFTKEIGILHPGDPAVFDPAERP